MTNQGIATVLSESENYENLAVTSGDVTIILETVIVDDKFAYLLSSVKGYSIESGMEPGFGTVDTYLGDDPQAEAGGGNEKGNLEYVIRVSVAESLT